MISVGLLQYAEDIETYINISNFKLVNVYRLFYIIKFKYAT